MDNCCDSPNLCKQSEELLICKNCGILIEYDDLNECYNPNTYRQNNAVYLTCNNVKKTKYCVDPNNVIHNKKIKLFQLLKNKNLNSKLVKLHDNFLKRAIDAFIELTKYKTIRANNREEVLSYILSRVCMCSENPITVLSLVRYMKLPKGGNSRGKKIVI